MTAGHILLVDHQRESSRQICFLLNLCDLRFAAARTVCEAKNWITSLQDEVNRFDLMLINNVANKTDLFALFDLVTCVPEGLAVLLVERHWTLEELIQEAAVAQNGRLYSCCPEGIIALLHQIGKKNTDPLATQ